MDEIGFDERGAAVLQDWLAVVRRQLPEWLYERRPAIVTAKPLLGALPSIRRQGLNGGGAAASIAAGATDPGRRDVPSLNRRRRPGSARPTTICQDRAFRHGPAPLAPKECPSTGPVDTRGADRWLLGRNHVIVRQRPERTYGPERPQATVRAFRGCRSDAPLGVDARSTRGPRGLVACSSQSGSAVRGPGVAALQVFGGFGGVAVLEQAVNFF